MSDKFMEGLTRDKWVYMTEAEWQSAFLMMSPSDFKAFFFDEMTLDAILYFSDKLGDMDGFLEGLTVEDWKNLTQAEWEAFLMDAEIEDLVEFIHEMYALDKTIVFDLFRNMPHDMIEDFKNTPELAGEFSFEELEVIKKGVKYNTSTKDSIYDNDEDMDFNKRRHGDKKHHKKDREGEKKPHKGQHKADERPKGKQEVYFHKNGDPRPEGDHPHDKKEGDRKHDKKRHDRKPREEERPDDFYYDDVYGFVMDNEDFIMNDFEFADGLDELMQEEIWRAQVVNESEESTRGGEWSSSDDTSDDSDDSEFSNDSSSDSDDSDSSSDSDSSEMEFMRSKRRDGKMNKKAKNLKKSKKQKKANKKAKKSHKLAEKHEVEETLPATLEEVEPVDLSYNP